MNETIEKLRWLQEHAHSVHIDVNDHRSSYHTVEEAIDDDPRYRSLDEATKAECIRRGQLVLVQCYPDTPVGFFCIAHYDIEAAIALAFDAVAQRQR